MTTITTEHGHKIEFNQEKHVYIHNNEYVVGMSTLLGKLASPMLENWKISNMVNAIKKEMERQEIPIDKIEDIVRFSAERYFDTETERLIAVGKHEKTLVIIPYEIIGDAIQPITIHATTRQQIKFRLQTGRFIIQ